MLAARRSARSTPLPVAPGSSPGARTRVRGGHPCVPRSPTARDHPSAAADRARRLPCARATGARPSPPRLRECRRLPDQNRRFHLLDFHAREVRLVVGLALLDLLDAWRSGSVIGANTRSIFGAMRGWCRWRPRFGNPHEIHPPGHSGHDFGAAQSAVFTGCSQLAVPRCEDGCGAAAPGCLRRLHARTARE